MPCCRLCTRPFPNWVTIDGSRRNLSNRKYCLDCSPFGLHNTRQFEPGAPRAVRPGPWADLLEPKRCAHCGKDKPAKDFSLRPDGRRTFSWCRVCNNEHRRARFRADRFAALHHYSHGEMACGCCGERVVEFLSLDHVNDDGATHRRELGVTGGGQFYGWLRKTGYTYEGLVVACHNCNMARALYGQCPHKTGPVAHQERASIS